MQTGGGTAQKYVIIPCKQMILCGFDQTHFKDHSKCSNRNQPNDAPVALIEDITSVWIELQSWSPTYADILRTKALSAKPFCLLLDASESWHVPFLPKEQLTLLLEKHAKIIWGWGTHGNQWLLPSECTKVVSLVDLGRRERMSFSLRANRSGP